MISMTKVMVFGVFDGIHDGHRFFLKEAKNRGSYLIVAVAQDHLVERLKGSLPRMDLARRIDGLRKESLIDEVVMGDSELGAYEVIKKYKPRIIVLGYDQEELKKDIEKHLDDFKWKLELKTVGAHKPERFHSSLLR